MKKQNIWVGLDFGTSNSSISFIQDNHIRLFQLDPGNLNPQMLRSLIFIDRAHNHFVGSEAVRQYIKLETGRPVYWETRSMGKVKMVVASGGSSPIVYWDDMFIQVDTNAQGRLLQSIKTALRNPRYEGTQIFDTYYTVEDLIAILLRHLRQHCLDALDPSVNIEGVVLGRPVKFSDDEKIDARAQAKIKAAAHQAGFKKTAFEMEPVAAAYMYARQAETRQAVLVFDFGGGTLDMTIMRVGAGKPPRILATQGVLVGGDDLDRTLIHPLRKLLGEGATLRDRTPFPAHLLQLLESWQTMVMLSRPEYKRVLRSARRGSDPASIQRLETLVNKNLGFTLFQELEKAKIELSKNATARLDLQHEDLHLREMFTRPQFERLIEKYIHKVEQGINEVLAKSGLQPDQIQAVLRTGGSSEVPAFIRMLTNRFGYDRLRALSPFETIVGGLALRASEMS